MQKYSSFICLLIGYLQEMSHMSQGGALARIVRAVISNQEIGGMNPAKPQD